MKQPPPADEPNLLDALSRVVGSVLATFHHRIELASIEVGEAGGRLALGAGAGHVLRRVGHAFGLARLRTVADPGRRGARLDRARLRADRRRFAAMAART